MTDVDPNDLAPPDPHWGATGALKRRARVTDWGLQNAPGVADELAAGVADSYATIGDDQIEVNYVQIGGSCAATSPCYVQSIDDFYDSERGRWRMYDAQEMYRACGGTGENGVFTDDVLDRMRSVGLQEVGSPRRAKIAGYAFAPRVAGAWRRTIAAAMATSGPVVIATLLPAQFGWDSSGPLTSGYHQMAATRYTSLADDGLVVFANTWGRAWGKNGFGRLSWSHLEGQNFQKVGGYTYCYAYQIIDLEDLQPDPIPEPPLGVVRFDAWAKIKRGGRKIKLTLDPPVEVARLFTGHVVEVTQPLSFTAQVGIANADLMILRPLDGATTWQNGQAHVELRVVK